MATTAFVFGPQGTGLISKLAEGLDNHQLDNFNSIEFFIKDSELRSYFPDRIVLFHDKLSMSTGESGLERLSDYLSERSKNTRVILVEEKENPSPALLEFEKVFAGQIYTPALVARTVKAYQDLIKLSIEEVAARYYTLERARVLRTLGAVDQVEEPSAELIADDDIYAEGDMPSFNFGDLQSSHAESGYLDEEDLEAVIEEASADEDPEDEDWSEETVTDASDYAAGVLEDDSNAETDEYGNPIVSYDEVDQEDDYPAEGVDEDESAVEPMAVDEDPRSFNYGSDAFQELGLGEDTSDDHIISPNFSSGLIDHNDYVPAPVEAPSAPLAPTFGSVPEPAHHAVNNAPVRFPLQTQRSLISVVRELVPVTGNIVIVTGLNSALMADQAILQSQRLQNEGRRVACVDLDVENPILPLLDQDGYYEASPGILGSGRPYSEDGIDFYARGQGGVLSESALSALQNPQSVNAYSGVVLLVPFEILSRVQQILSASVCILIVDGAYTVSLTNIINAMADRSLLPDATYLTLVDRLYLTIQNVNEHEYPFLQESARAALYDRTDWLTWAV